MKSNWILLLGILIVLALSSGCASMGTGRQTAHALQMDQGSHIESTDRFVEEMIY